MKTALLFLHKYIGLVMYFPDNEKLKDYVICNPQVVFESLNKLVFNIYGSKNMDPHEHDLFVNSGQFFPRQVIPNTPEEKHLLPVQFLLDLLVHLKIAAKIAAKIPLDPEYYFLPAALQNLQTSEIIKKEELNSGLEPLFIRFKAGYVPLGFVCALIAHLIGRADFVLKGKRIYKNQIIMLFKEVFKVTILSCPRYLKVYAKAIHKADNNEGINHINVRKALCESADQVVKVMQHGSVHRLATKCYDFAFKCSAEEIHEEENFGCETLAIVNTCSDSNRTVLKCTHSDCELKKIPLTKKMMEWYCEVS